MLLDLKVLLRFNEFAFFKKAFSYVLTKGNIFRATFEIDSPTFTNMRIRIQKIFPEKIIIVKL